MKKIRITISLMVFVLMGISAQEKENTIFQLGPEMVRVYDYEGESKIKPKGITLVSVFEDDYSLKLTNEVYKVNLFFARSKKEQVEKAVLKVMDGENASGKYDTMVWKKTSRSKIPMYEVYLVRNKLKIRINRELMDKEAYGVINQLGEEFLKAIRS